ncbi:calpain-like cysteine peptidase, Clan CA, family C2 [Leishmania major strain Friedlin]|uniref:Calpain-like cysteine peptidase, Clan CA, family C2 n=1 Tax=Leishmania major TaxID=5664 RepID=Q4QCS4_LEIMA|nr:calpain-like cysteine peptidase, Clan CA, family C2 [Leishmania major strain Friedlin]CAG9573195.1 calpain-like_cysteine_peptidase_-_Clan_CA_-_family_C2 [Leishmania major strain Friedlin]CAJ04214.1 calpain-like cysteine peptidase, Clan CA, family C2 [Leishmania major strain Friedlin]|eukprot:XP_001682874.1 calpain-like cysteine peptidase, Clan CA, family C2 [Leishmania major strain Friedlin]
MGCFNSTDAVADQDPASGYMYTKPNAKGTKEALFGGLLYRITDEEEGGLAFYNNSKDYEFHIKYLFGADSELNAVGDTKLEMQDDGILAEVVVYPLETKPFVQGTIDGYETKLEALPLSEEYFALHPEIDEAAYYRRLEAPKSSRF